PAIDHLVDVVIGDGTLAADGFQSFISIQLDFRKDLNSDLQCQRLLAEAFEHLLVFKLDVGLAEWVQRMFDEGIVDGVGEQFAQHFASDLALVTRAHDGRGRMSRPKAGDGCSFAVLLTDPIESLTHPLRFDLDLELFYSWRDVC